MRRRENTSRRPSRRNSEKFPEPPAGQASCRARDSGQRSAPPSKKALIAARPSLNLDAGVLYQYKQAAAEELKRDQERVSASARREARRGFRECARRAARRACPRLTCFIGAIIARPKQAVTAGRPDHRRPRRARLEITTRAADSPKRGPAAGVRPASYQRTPSLGRTRAGESGLAASLRPRPGRDAGRLRSAGHPADASRTAGLAGHELVASGLEPEAAAPTDHDLDGLSPVVAPRAGRDAADADNACAAIRCGGSTPRRCATDPGYAADGWTGRCSAGRRRWSRIPSARSIAADDSPRRSIYLQVRRTRPVSLLTAFDAPVMAVNCDRRVPSTWPAIADAHE